MKFRLDPQKKSVRSPDRPDFMIAKVAMAHPEFKSTPTFSDFPSLLGPWPAPISQGADTLRKSYGFVRHEIWPVDRGSGLLPKSKIWGKSYSAILRYSPPSVFGAPRNTVRSQFWGFCGDFRDIVQIAKSHRFGSPNERF